MIAPDSRGRILPLAAMIAGLIGLAYLVWASVAPIEARPHFFDETPDISRFLGWFTVTLAIAIACPGRLGRVLLVMTAAILLIEAAQLLELSRHGRIEDALVKIAGAWAAVGFTRLGLSAQRKRERDAAV